MFVNYTSFVSGTQTKKRTALLVVLCIGLWAADTAMAAMTQSSCRTGLRALHERRRERIVTLHKRQKMPHSGLVWRSYVLSDATTLHESNPNHKSISDWNSTLFHQRLMQMRLGVTRLVQCFTHQAQNSNTKPSKLRLDDLSPTWKCCMLHSVKSSPRLSALGTASSQQRNCFEATAYTVPGTRPVVQSNCIYSTMSMSSAHECTQSPVKCMLRPLSHINAA